MDLIFCADFCFFTFVWNCTEGKKCAVTNNMSPFRYDPFMPIFNEAPNERPSIFEFLPIRRELIPPFRSPPPRPTRPIRPMDMIGWIDTETNALLRDLRPRSPIDRNGAADTEANALLGDFEIEFGEVELILAEEARHWPHDPESPIPHPPGDGDAELVHSGTERDLQGDEVDFVQDQDQEETRSEPEELRR